MDDSQSTYESTSQSEKLLRKMEENPSVPIGLVGLAGVVTYSLYNLKKRNKSLSIYLIHTRVAAQGTLMACMTLGVLYTFCSKHWDKLFPGKKDK